MKNSYSFFSLLLSIILSGCINESLPDTPEIPHIPDGNYSTIELPGYIGIKINTSGKYSTRGDDSSSPSSASSFHDGDPSEYALAPGEGYHYVILYKKNSEQSPAAIIPISITDEDIEYDDDTENGNTTYDNLTLTVNKIIMSSAFASDNSFKDIEAIKNFLENTEAYFILNFDKQIIDTSAGSYPSTGSSTSSTIDILNNLSLTALKNLYLKDWKITMPDNGKDIDYFTMSNSVYASNDLANIIYDYTIDSKNVFESQDQAKNYPAISAHVERIAAKATVNDNKGILETNAILSEENVKVKVFKDLTQDYTYKTEEKPWTATVLGYGLNGLEPAAFLLKNIQGKIYFPNWNDNNSTTNNYRSYWAEDPHYVINDNISKYPQQYRTALDNITLRHYSGGDTFDDQGSISKFNPDYTKYFLNYISFNDLLEKTGSLYSLENTYDDSHVTDYLGERGFFSASTHLLIACKMSITGENGDDFYRDQNEIFFTSKDKLLETKLQILQDKILSEGNSGLYLDKFDWSNNPSNSNNSPITWAAENKLKIQKESDVQVDLKDSDLTLIPAEITGGDGQVVIAPADKTAKFFIGETNLNYNEVVSLFYKLFGPIDHYKNGYMYYATPIPHTKSKTSEIEWNVVGDVGLVRNNWYNLIVGAVSVPGTPVSYAEQPIIPMVDVKNLLINVKVNDWDYDGGIEDEW